MAFYDGLFEELKKTFYSEREARVEINKNKQLSTTTPAILTTEPDVVLTDVSHQFTIGSQVDFILTRRNELIKQWRSAVYLPEVDEAVGEIINEALVFEEDDSIPIELDLEDLELHDNMKEKIKESFEKILGLLDFSKKGPMLFRQWYVDGVINFECVYDNKRTKEGIQKIILLSPFDFFKIKDITSGKTEFFFSNRLSNDMYNRPNFNLIQLMNHAPTELKYKDEQITQVASDVQSLDRLFSVSNINKAIKVINQVGLIEDSIIIYRITRAPDKKAFYIDTGRLPKGQAEQYINTMMNKHRNKLSYNVETGQIENRKRVVAMSQDFWLSRNAEGRGTQIETIQGTGQELRDIADLDYFYEKMYRALNVPVNRRNKTESRTPNLNSQQVDIEREEIKFFKFVLQLRKQFNGIFRDMLKKDLISTKIVSLEDWYKIKDKLKFKYKNNNEYAEMKKLQVFETRMNIAALADSLVESRLVSRAWVRREVLNQNEEETKEIDKELEKEKAEEPPEEEENGGSGPPEK